MLCFIKNKSLKFKSYVVVQHSAVERTKSVALQEMDYIVEDK